MEDLRVAVIVLAIMEISINIKTACQKHSVRRHLYIGQSVFWSQFILGVLSGYTELALIGVVVACQCAGMWLKHCNGIPELMMRSAVEAILSLAKITVIVMLMVFRKYGWIIVTDIMIESITFLILLGFGKRKETKA